MEAEDVIKAIEEESQVIDQGHGMAFVDPKLERARKKKDTFRIIDEEKWKEIKKKFMPRYGFDESDRLVEVLDDE